jgi:RNA polymerase sigma factor (sigma-70 family)
VNATELTDGAAAETEFDIEGLFRLHYGRVVRVIARVVREKACAEDLAVELFLKLWRKRSEVPEGTLYRAAGRIAIDHLRSAVRRERYERATRLFSSQRSPEELAEASQERARVQRVLAAIDRRKAELLLLRTEGFSYLELAAAFDLSPGSVGTLLNRAEETFRKEYVKRYGER